MGSGYNISSREAIYVRVGSVASYTWVLLYIANLMKKIEMESEVIDYRYNDRLLLVLLTILFYF